ncbi:MAG TPA: HNH endonuclease [Candidatus Desulfaltia sp.]|nr:HNH endonuclease [Candidatus Desulfaltia sp.]
MAISKTLRFEVFKRDGFRCGYCGKTPPDVILEVDHINPVSLGGKNDINNLITACFDCNRGKKNIELSRIPSSLKTNLSILAERELQLSEYNKFIEAIEKRYLSEIRRVEKIFRSYFPDLMLVENFKQISIKNFLKHLPVSEVCEAMRMACDRIKDADNGLRYFCGICWKKIRGE